jgi:hypothetical protein
MGFWVPPMVDVLGNRRWLYGHGHVIPPMNFGYDNGPPAVEFPGVVGGGVGGGAQALYAATGSPGRVLFNSTLPKSFPYFYTAVPLRWGLSRAALTYLELIPRPQ